MRYILLTATLLTVGLFAAACGTTEKPEKTTTTQTNIRNSTLTTSQPTSMPNANANSQTTVGDRDDMNRRKMNDRNGDERDGDDRRSVTTNSNGKRLHTDDGRRKIENDDKRRQDRDERNRTNSNNRYRDEDGDGGDDNDDR